MYPANKLIINSCFHFSKIYPHRKSFKSKIMSESAASLLSKGNENLLCWAAPCRLTYQSLKRCVSREHHSSLHLRMLILKQSFIPHLFIHSLQQERVFEKDLKDNQQRNNSLSCRNSQVTLTGKLQRLQSTVKYSKMA